ncbi:MAG: 3-hydroxyacyl-CoA dehydrogenase family protein [Thermoplasmatota archaeon]
MFVEKVGVVGAGLMGAAIAEVMALNGKQVVLKDVNEELVQRGLKSVDTVLDDLVTFHAGKADAEIARIEDGNGIKLTDAQKAQIRDAKKPTYTRERAAEIRERIRGTTNYADFADVDLVIEAVIERMDIKKKVFAELEQHTPKHAVLATNTSALPISEIQGALKDRRGKFVATHFFNPPYQMPLVEIVPAVETNPGTVEETVSFFEELRNHRFPMLPIVVKETPGFVVNRVLARAMNEAFLIYEEGIASPRDIDKAMRAGAGWPMGPLELTDMVGIDTSYHVGRNMREMGVSETQRAAQIISQLYHTGRWGKKTGRGFYDYRTEE